jgi:Transposase DDE domain
VWDQRPANDTRKRQSLNRARLHRVVDAVFGEELHKKRVLSLANAAVGVMQAASLAVSSIGRGLAIAEGLAPKHAIKQVDRMLSNDGIDVDRAQALWASFVVGTRKEILVALDWTEFDRDRHSTLALHLVTKHGRATPLLWKTVSKARLRGRRNTHEDRLLQRLRAVIADDVKVTVLADRGFGDAALYALHWELGFDHVIRFRGDVIVTNANGESHPAKEWLLPSGRARILRDVTVTGHNAPVPAVVCVWAKGMKEPWFLACGEGSRSKTAATLVKLYARRFTIEEAFRDTKDIHFGMGLSSTRVTRVKRRDRLLLLSALATGLLSLLGAAGESLGFDRDLRANTVKHRTHSLFFQGTFYFGALANMKTEKRQVLLLRFDELLREHAAIREILGLL